MERHLNRPFGRDDLFAWWRVTGLVLDSVSQQFKEHCRPVLEYEIPYGLSPQIKFSTIEALVQSAKGIAIPSLIKGVDSVSAALATQQWVVALEAAATTGGTIIIIMASVALVDLFTDWLKRRETPAK